MTDDVLGHCQEAVAKLDYLLRNHPAETAEELTDAVRCTVSLRDQMIERRRGRARPCTGPKTAAGQFNYQRDRRLGEFPLMGIRWQRIEGARDLLNRFWPKKRRARDSRIKRPYTMP